MVHDLREDERELAGAILEGSKAAHRPGVRRLLPRGRNSSCALGAAYEGIYRLPDTADGVRPQRLDRCSNASKAWCAPVPNAARRSCRWER